MAITRSFGGQTLLKPGAYSVQRVDNAQSLATGDNDTLMLIGESENGTDSGGAGGEGTARMFSASQVQGLIDYYGSGDIVDAALAAVRPSITPGVSGPGVFIVYKTNVGTSAAQALTFSDLTGTSILVAGDILRFEVPVNASGETTNVDLVWGTDIDIPAGTTQTGVALAANVRGDRATGKGILGSPALRNFVSVMTAADAIVTLTAVKQGPEFNSIKSFGLTSLFANKAYYSIGVTPITIDGANFLGGAANLGATTTSQLNDAYADAFNFDPNVIVPLWSNPIVGAGAAAEGSIEVQGTASADIADITINFTNAGGAITPVVLNVLIANTDTASLVAIKIVNVWNASMSAGLVDYTASIDPAAPANVLITADARGTAFNMSSFVVTPDGNGLVFVETDAIGGGNDTPIPAGNPNAGTAFIEITANIAAGLLQSHLIQRSSTSVRKEAQGMIGGRFADWQNSFNNTTFGFGGINSFLIQAFIQDVRVFDSQGMLTWKAPHILASQAAGIRLGTTVGEPLTFKFVNANSIGHFINTETGNFDGTTQFRPGFDFNVAIINGITFTEIASGGNRIVVDNTRYAIDESFVFNRGSVIEAAQFVARTSRQLLERIFVGQKVSNGAALSLKNVLRNYLIQLNTDNIITTSSDAPFGFVEETFTVTINGNTAAIQVEIKPVQGLDFIFIDFTLGNITQSA